MEKRSADFVLRGAEYYEEYERDILATNEVAKLNHPEIKTI